MPQRQQDRSDRGAVTVRALVSNAPRCKSILEALHLRCLGICERFNGWRDPSMTLELSGRIRYSRLVHTLVATGISQLPHAPAMFTLPQSLLRESHAA